MKKEENKLSAKQKAKRFEKQRAIQKQVRAEAEARRKIAHDWERLSRSARYQKSAAKMSSRNLTQTLKDELFDGIFLNFRGDMAKKSHKCQKRNLRRIVEKRQAQSMHRIVGRSGDRYAAHMLHHFVGKSMTQLRNHMLCAC
ncbi:MAG: hypothetical protein J6V12_10155 [Bacteroidaceae bacterium]|nr:hypothetical protein [Bacteroidaceae bacterium]